MGLSFIDPGFALAAALVLLLGVVGLAADRWGCDSRDVRVEWPIEHHS
ncbi:MAG TPA: hypothetical protein VF763_11860 [Candidatus Limnocylindrales bacterium]